MDVLQVPARRPLGPVRPRRQEISIWRPLERPCRGAARAGPPVLVEVDSWFLPDTAGTAYQSEHVKTTVAATRSTSHGQPPGLFPQRGLLRARGRRLRERVPARRPRPGALPPYVEFVKLDPGSPPVRRRPHEGLARAAAPSTRAPAARQPRSSASKRRFQPISSGSGRGDRDVPPLRVRDAAPVRRLVRAARDLLQWLGEHARRTARGRAERFAEICRARRRRHSSSSRAMARRRRRCSHVARRHDGARGRCGMAKLDRRSPYDVMAALTAMLLHDVSSERSRRGDRPVGLTPPRSTGSRPVPGTVRRLVASGCRSRRPRPRRSTTGGFAAAFDCSDPDAAWVLRSTGSRPSPTSG